MYRLIKFETAKECEYIQKYLFKNNFRWIVSGVEIKYYTNGYIVLNEKNYNMQKGDNIEDVLCFIKNEPYTETAVKQIIRKQKINKLYE